MKSVSRLGKIEFTGNIDKPHNISAIDVIHDFLLILGSDETNKVQVLKCHGDHYKVLHDVTLNASAKEIDIEGIACEGDTVYVIGSHSSVRKKVNQDELYECNHAALETVERKPDRDRLCRFHVDTDGKPTAIEETSLWPFIEGNKILERFSKMPSKENGVDIEGIAVRDEQLYVGFRGPVLRENLVPVLKCRFAQPVTGAELIFVNLGGRGFRDLTRVCGGFLVLAGPVGDGPGSYQVYFWDGEDCLSGVRVSGKAGQIKLLGEIPIIDEDVKAEGLAEIPVVDEDVKAEGLALLSEDNSAYEVLIVYDSMKKKNGGPTRFRIIKP